MTYGTPARSAASAAWLDVGIPDAVEVEKIGIGGDVLQGGTERAAAELVDSTKRWQRMPGQIGEAGHGGILGFDLIDGLGGDLGRDGYIGPQRRLRRGEADGHHRRTARGRIERRHDLNNAQGHAEHRVPTGLAGGHPAALTGCIDVDSPFDRPL